MKKYVFSALFIVVLGSLGLGVYNYTKDSSSESLGSIDSKFNYFSPNDKIEVLKFKDPELPVLCNISTARTGGWSSTVNLAEDKSDTSISCVKKEKIVNPNIKNQELVFKNSKSLINKNNKVVRFYDKKENTITYLSYTDKVIDGSPKSSIVMIQLD